MVIFRWLKPGHFPEADIDSVDEIKFTFGALENCIIEANVALNYFEQERFRRNEVTSAKEVWERKEAYLQRARDQLKKKLDYLPASDIFAHRAQEAEAQQIAMKLKLDDGILPRSYEGKLIWIFAKSFVNTLDEYFRQLKHLEEIKKCEY